MQVRGLGFVGSRSALALMLALVGSTASAQAPPPGAPDGSSNGSSGASKFADMKVSIDTDSGRLVEVVPKLLKSVGAEFVVDGDVKNARVSSHLANVRLKIVLDVLMRGSSIPIQYTFDKGVYHFSKKVEPPPEAPAPTPSVTDEPLLPPPPTTQTEDVDIHNVQTFDLLRVLNGLFGVPVAIDPSGEGAAGRGSIAGSLPGFGPGGPVRGNNSSNGSQAHGSGSSFTLFGHAINLSHLSH